MRIKNIISMMIVFTAISILLPAGSVCAGAPYDSFAYGTDKRLFRIQTPYAPVNVIGNVLIYRDAQGNEIAKPGIETPNDIFIDSSDYIYVADTKGNRIVKITEEGLLLEEYGNGAEKSGQLNAPEGVYVAPDGNIYAADTGNNRIAVFSPEGDLVKEYKKPDDIRLSNVMFSPVRISMDIRGFLFVVLKGGNEGIMILTPEGKFDGYFGGNKVDLSPLEKLKRAIFSKEQIRKSSVKEAPSISDVFVGNDSYIYSCTRNVKKGQVKKYNSGAEDLFKEKDMQVRSTTTQGSFGGITVDKNGIITIIDTAHGIVCQYDNNGEALISFGGKLMDNNLKVGVFGDPTAIAVNSKGNLFVTDRAYKGVHVFRPTDFMMKIHQATALYNDGKYLESKGLWEEILDRNVNYYKANLGLGKAYTKNRQWTEAMEELRVARHKEFYSEALWQARLEWLQKYFGFIASSLLVLGFLYLGFSKAQKRRKGGAKE